MKPTALDLYCRKGGATAGLQAAGFTVIGIDKDPQPGYPGDDFIQADVPAWLQTQLPRYGRMFTLIASSPPCQEANAISIGTNKSQGWGGVHEQFVPITRQLLIEAGFPFYIEQPTSSRKGTIRRDLTLCMDMFKGDMPPPWVQKHRSFEIHGFTVPQPTHPKGWVRGHNGYVRGWRHGINRTGPTAPYVAGYGDGGGKAETWELQHAMRIPWMTEKFDLCEAIPPAFTEHIGKAALS